MIKGHISVPAALALLISGCTDDSRPSASLEQIDDGLAICGITDAEIAEGVENATTDLIVSFSQNTARSARECFSQEMQRMDVLQTTAWSGSEDAQTH